MPIEAGKLKGLLGLLLLRAGETCPSEQLVEELWVGNAPESAAKLLNVYVSQLRKHLHTEGDQPLQTHGRGYALEVDATQIDARRFEALIREGRSLRMAEPAAAVERLTEALHLWRGPPLADFRYLAFAQSEVDRLEELRLVAVEARIEAELELGRHSEMVGELKQLVAREPLRERPYSLLMLALYRAGRKAEALDAYQRVRQELVEQLGIEPSPELRALQGAILRDDGSLVHSVAQPRAVRPLTVAADRTGAEIEALVHADRVEAPLLHWRDRDDEPRIFVLPTRRNRVTIGRIAASDVVLKGDDEISRAHAVLESDGGYWTLVDDGLSKNGSFVNGDRVQGRRRLRDRDRLRFGSTHVSYREPVDADDVESTARAFDVSASVELSETQRTVLIALCRPLGAARSRKPATNREIAGETGLSVETVREQLQVLFGRFDIGPATADVKRAQLAVKALAEGAIADGS